MRQRLPKFLLVGVATVFAAGCSHTSIDGEGLSQEQVIHGTVGIKGEDNELTILPDSEVTKLSIMGQGNRVVVEDGAVVYKIEIVGEDNEVVCPEGMSIEYSTIGENNCLRYRS